MFGPESLERSYKGYRIEGGAQSQGPNSNLWLLVVTVLLKKPDGTLLQVHQYRDPLLAYESGDLAAWFGLGVAEILVDQCLPVRTLSPANDCRTRSRYSPSWC